MYVEQNLMIVHSFQLIKVRNIKNHTAGHVKQNSTLRKNLMNMLRRSMAYKHVDSNRRLTEKLHNLMLVTILYI